MIERTLYLRQLREWREKDVIKVVTGIRRCGKSTLLRQFQDELRKSGVGDDQILSVNFEELEFEALLDYRALYAYLKERLHPTKTTYVFLDEIQLVPDFQKAVDSLYVKRNVDVYITGSNAYLLSGELATLLSGRYVEIHLLPLSFAEFCALKGAGARDALFAAYLKTGGLPYAAALEDDGMADTYLEGIYNTILVKDVEERQKRRETDPGKRKVTDLALLQNIAKFLAGSIGSPISVKRIADYVTSSGRKISQNTVNDYVQALVEPYLFYPAERYDVLGKQLLKSNRKLYMVDLGLRRHILARQGYDLGFSLENVVYFELLRRGFRVNVGKVGATEIDFVARKSEDVRYYQVTASMAEEATFERELAPLRNIRDNYPKTVLTLDRYACGNYDGVEVVEAERWLTAPEARE